MPYLGAVVYYYIPQGSYQSSLHLKTKVPRKHLLEEQELRKDEPFYIQPDEGPLDTGAIKEELVEYLDHITGPGYYFTWMSIAIIMCPERTW